MAAWLKAGWWQLPSRIALALGLGSAAVASDARADLPAPQPNNLSGPAVPWRFGDMTIRTDGERVYVAEQGGGFRELPLSNTPETQLLLKLLAGSEGAASASGITLNPMLLAGSGGQSIHRAPVGDPNPRDQSGEAGQPGQTGQAAAPASPAPSGPKKTPGAKNPLGRAEKG